MQYAFPTSPYSASQGPVPRRGLTNRAPPGHPLAYQGVPSLFQAVIKTLLHPRAVSA